MEYRKDEVAMYGVLYISVCEADVLYLLVIEYYISCNTSYQILDYHDQVPFYVILINYASNENSFPYKSVTPQRG